MPINVLRVKSAIDGLRMSLDIAMPGCATDNFWRYIILALNEVLTEKEMQDFRRQVESKRREIQEEKVC